MFHFTSAEGTAVGACITSIGYVYLAKRQKASATVTVEARDVLTRVENRLDDLGRTLSSHTADDAANFRELRDAVRGRGPGRRRSWLPALSLLVHLFLK